MVCTLFAGLLSFSTSIQNSSTFYASIFQIAEEDFIDIDISLSVDVSDDIDISSVDGCLDCFHFSIVIHKTTVSIHVPISART